jgi:hypothetical protein
MRSPAALPLLAAFLAAPLQAQIASRHDYGPAPVSAPFLPDSRLPGAGIGGELAHLRGRIERAREAGTISRREARRLGREARLIGSIARRYARDGLSSAEQSELASRARIVESRIGGARVRR